MRKVQILIISLVIILVLGCTVFSVLYFTTDVFKTSGSNKEMFYKYASQINLDGFVDTEFYNNYSDQLKDNKHKEDTKIIIEYEDENLDEKINQEINVTSKRDLQNKALLYTTGNHT